MLHPTRLQNVIGTEVQYAQGHVRNKYVYNYNNLFFRLKIRKILGNVRSQFKSCFVCGLSPTGQYKDFQMLLYLVKFVCCQVPL